MKNKPTTQTAFKVVPLSNVPERHYGAPSEPRTSRYSAAINAAAKYTKRAILLDTPQVTTNKQAMITRYGVLSAIRSRKLHKVLEVVQRGTQLYIRRTRATAPNKPTTKV